MTTYVVGTAGHVDHGKSTLVKAMTGIDPDRLKEEKARQLTIDLGFAWMTLPDEINVGIVDVPGHRDFIENMLAGVGGIDAALLIIAVDEGVMPQTREHLEILDLLEIPRGIIALTKVDLVQEEGWVQLVEDDVRQLLQGTSLSDAPCIRVSSTTGDGVDELKRKLGEILKQSIPKTTSGRARVPVDRSFSLPGYGTIITGTLLDGPLKVGQEVRLLPSGREGRIRGLQTHKQDVDVAEAGSRVAVNISGIDADDVVRGHVVVVDEADRPSQLIDVQVRVLSSSSVPIEHNQEVKLFVLSEQKIARVRVLGGTDRVFPGEEGWLQLMVRDPMVVRRGDRFILRRPSPPLTLAGGQIVDPYPTRRHRLRDEGITRRLEMMLAGSQEEVIASALTKLGITSPERISREVNLPLENVRHSLERMEANDQVISLETTSDAQQAVISKPNFSSIQDQAIKALEEFHQRFPLRSGMPVEELRSRLNIRQEIYPGVLDHLLDSGHLSRSAALVKLARHQATLSDHQQEQIERLLQWFNEAPMAPPTRKECLESIGEELFGYLMSSEILTQVSEDVVFRSGDYEEMVLEVKKLIEEKGSVTVAEVRDHFDTSRKYALALMEHLDERRITNRIGDHRELAD